MTTSRRGRGRGQPAARRMPLQRRTSEWFDTVLNAQIPSSGELRLNLLSQVAEDDIKGLTVTRLIPDFWVTPVAAGGLGRVGAGITLVSDEAVAAVAFPDPTVADDQPGWMWRQNFIVMSDAAGVKGTHIKADLRGQRKMPSEDMNMYLIVTAGVLIQTVDVNGMVRLLALKAA